MAKQNLKSKQTGASMISVFAFLVLLVFSLNFVVRIAGMHWDDRLLSTVLDNLPEVVNRDTTVKEIQKLIGKRLHMNSLRKIPVDELVITKKKGVINLTWQYERREHVMSNVDIVTTFSHEYSY